MKFDEWKLNVSEAADEIIDAMKAFPAVVAKIDEVEPGTFTEDEAMAYMVVCNARITRGLDGEN